MVSVWRGTVEPSRFLVVVADSGESIEKSSEGAERLPRFRYHCTPKVRCRGTRLSSGAKQHKASAASAVELAHEAREGFDGFEADRVVERDAHTAYGPVAGRAHEASA